MPDQPSPRRRFQFRLRTLMIVVTLLAVGCWVVVDRQRLIRERDEANNSLQDVREALQDAKIQILINQERDEAERELEAIRLRLLGGNTELKRAADR